MNRKAFMCYVSFCTFWWEVWLHSLPAHLVSPGIILKQLKNIFFLLAFPQCIWIQMQNILGKPGKFIMVPSVELLGRCVGWRQSEAIHTSEIMVCFLFRQDKVFSCTAPMRACVLGFSVQGYALAVEMMHISALRGLNFHRSWQKTSWNLKNDICRSLHQGVLTRQPQMAKTSSMIYQALAPEKRESLNVCASIAAAFFFF